MVVSREHQVHDHERRLAPVTDWNFADIWETVADQIPGADAMIEGDRHITWSDFDNRADGVARTLLDLGLGRQDKVAHYLRNCAEYLESMFGMMKVGMVPVNTNYRYGQEELHYLWDNSDAAAIIFEGSFCDRVENLRPRLSKVRLFIWVDDSTAPCPDWALPYEEAATSATSRVTAPWGRGGDDLYLLYTGGTTGVPKGVMWRQDDLFCRLNAGNVVKVPENDGLEGIRKTVQGPGPVHLPACPLMHGTGAFSSIGMLSLGDVGHAAPTELLSECVKSVAAHHA